MEALGGFRIQMRDKCQSFVDFSWVKPWNRKDPSRRDCRESNIGSKIPQYVQVHERLCEESEKEQPWENQGPRREIPMKREPLESQGKGEHTLSSGKLII